ncbi:MAG: ABC transporter ATP-binding protein [Phycisphaerales bacterium]
MSTPASHSNPSASPAAISATGLSKHYGAFRAVHDVSFSIQPGRLVAFLGPNGAGKSTTMRMLTGFLAPTAGSAALAGVDVLTNRVEAARRLGYLPENGPFYPDMTPVSYLRFIGRARGMDAAKLRERLDLVIQQCQISEVVGRPVGKLSKGYKQRVGMAAALLHDPDVLILDEPTAGLDPNQVEHVRLLLKSLAARRAILLSTHILSEVRALADRILVIARGRLVHDGGPSSLGSNEREMEEKFRALTKVPRRAA